MLLNWYSSMKKMRKILMIFDIENWFWKSNQTLFDTFRLHQSPSGLMFIWCLGKNLSNFVPPAWKLDNPYYHDPRYQVGAFWTILYAFQVPNPFSLWTLFPFWVRTYVFRKVFEEKLWFSIKTINNPYFCLWCSLFELQKWLGCLLEIQSLFM